jgi:hypothetical protein
MQAATFLATPFIPLFYVVVVRLFGKMKRAETEKPAANTASPAEAR